MVRIFDLNYLANRWSGCSLEGEAREVAHQKFKVTAFNRATAALIASFALILIFGSNPVTLITAFLAMCTRSSILYTIDCEQMTALYCETQWQFLDFIIRKQMLPPQAASEQPMPPQSGATTADMPSQLEESSRETATPLSTPQTPQRRNQSTSAINTPVYPAPNTIMRGYAALANLDSFRGAGRELRYGNDPVRTFR